ncbi:MAG: hypothetical protein J7463_17565 [Roseiflexus sp.]|jgi:hypothetical protein|nr:hypothetical protein [Roseiflexus sp.]MBO9334360.1 hypothetical protein [Roseiflexus sp.]MBO9366757.1 hypothetical protein [Roseiflexus sp.]MBO9389196.1 hypothetical protein [Roseiflexus sp.]
MPRVDVEPEELLRFAAELKAFNEQLRERTSRLRVGFKQIGRKMARPGTQKVRRGV